MGKMKPLLTHTHTHTQFSNNRFYAVFIKIPALNWNGLGRKAVEFVCVHVIVLNLSLEHCHPLLSRVASKHPALMVESCRVTAEVKGHEHSCACSPSDAVFFFFT